MADTLPIPAISPFAPAACMSLVTVAIQRAFFGFIEPVFMLYSSRGSAGIV
jgi:hypothetical protein